MRPDSRRMTDERIRHILDNTRSGGGFDYWSWLEEQTDDPGLKDEIHDRAMRAWYADEDSVGLL